MTTPLRSIPTLLQFGRDLTRDARKGKLCPVVARDAETRLLLEILCRRTKRNPILVGPAGVGKTAVVEGFAMMVASGNVPHFMKDSIVVLLQPSLILAASRGQQGNLEKWMSAILSEASQDGVILFIDEIHTIVGAGGMAGTADIASMMKPPLARGDIACIAATTDDEYRRFIEADAALERRFQPIRVQELDISLMLQVMKVVRNELAASRGVFVDDPVLERLLEHAHTYMRNRNFPDKGIDLLEQCVASALVKGTTSVEPSDADEVFSRISGTPLDLEARFNRLETDLLEIAVMSADDIQAFLGRLKVTMRGLDLRTVRPNAVVLLVDSSAQQEASLAEIISMALYDTPERVVTFDMNRISTPEECTLFFGAPPGYVGYSDTAPIHAIKQSPATVLLLQNIDSCDKQARELIEQGINDGYLLDGQARKIFLSDTIILLTAMGGTSKRQVIGFGKTNRETSLDLWRRDAEDMLGASLLDVVDLVCFSSSIENRYGTDWLKKGMLSSIEERYQKLNLQVTWDETLVDWLMSEFQQIQNNENHLERIVDKHITPAVIKFQEKLTNEHNSILIAYSDAVVVKLK